jgi:hypothetical protein
MQKKTHFLNEISSKKLGHFESIGALLLNELHDKQIHPKFFFMAPPH